MTCLYYFAFGSMPFKASKVMSMTAKLQNNLGDLLGKQLTLVFSQTNNCSNSQMMTLKLEDQMSTLNKS